MLSSMPMAWSGWQLDSRRKIEVHALSSRLLLLALAFVCPPALAAAHAGDALLQALRDYQHAGTRLIFSSQFITEDLRVLAAPQGATVEQQLRSILLPHHLDLQPLAAGGWIIVPQAHAAPANPPDPPAPASPVRSSQRLDEVVVETSRYGFERTAVTTPINLDRVRIEEMPGTNEDVARSLQHLPGAAAGDYSARTHVRGGRDDETSFRFDGVTLIDPFHLKNFQGLFSAIDPAVTDSVTYWTGAFPVEFGGSIGGVVDVSPRTPTALVAEVGVSMLNTSLLFGSPFADGRGSILLSGRASNLSHVARLLDREIGEPDFKDLTARATWALNDKTALTAGVLGLDDSVTLSTQDPVQAAEADYRDAYAWLKLQHEWQPNLHSETLLSSATLDASRDSQVVRPGINSGHLNELRNSSILALRQEVNWSARADLTVRGGAEYSNARSHALIDSSADFERPFYPGVQPAAHVERNLDVRARYSTLALYSAARWQFTDDTIIELGMRRDSQHFQSEQERSQWNTRINLRQRLSPTTTLRLAWGQYSQPQALSRLDVADGIVDLAMARRSTQASLSLERTFDNGALLRFEAYDKREHSSMSSYENAFSLLVLTPEIEVDRLIINSDSAHMRGYEVSFMTDRNRPLSAWASYAYSQAYDRIGGVDVRRSWNQPHAIQAGALWKHRAWQFSGIMNWHSGWPFTPLIASANSWVDPASVELTLAPRNSAQQKHFRSLDLRISWTKPLRIGTFEASLEVKNAFNSDNECCRSYQIAQDAGGRSSLIESSRDWLPVTPILGVRWRR